MKMPLTLVGGAACPPAGIQSNLCTSDLLVNGIHLKRIEAIYGFCVKEKSSLNPYCLSILKFGTTENEDTPTWASILFWSKKYRMNSIYLTLPNSLSTFSWQFHSAESELFIGNIKHVKDTTLNINFLNSDGTWDLEYD